MNQTPIRRLRLPACLIALALMLPDLQAHEGGHEGGHEARYGGVMEARRDGVQAQPVAHANTHERIPRNPAPLTGEAGDGRPARLDTGKAELAARSAPVPVPLPAPETSLPSSAARSLAVGAAYAPDGRLWLVGVDATGRLFVQSSVDGGRQWQAPAYLDTGTDRIAAEGENRPKIAFGPAGQVVISYTRPLAKPYTGDIRLLHSSDGGAHFSAPQTVHQDRQVITHRFESLIFDRQGRLHLVWIDKRDKVAGPAAYRGAAIYHAVSEDGGAHFFPEQKLADYSCECCRIAVTLTPAGQPALLWRHIFPPNIRDHAFLALDRPGDTPMQATQDGWALDACPHHGPGLVPAADGGYHAVWFGQRQGKAGVRYGRLRPDGRPLGAVQLIPDPAAEHADVLADGLRVLIVWRSYDGRKTRLMAWQSVDGGQHFTLRQLADSEQASDHPRLLTGPTGMQVIWRTLDNLRVIHVDF